eukprot:CAMPEP_0178375956 /NCGR_PEP_ID=MMETSP0689_2-20121128/3156_1 /TAXON_ID=160604 /ORGANISM="Amphidinium massartii, Strain CS-259" /LENGTH=58 /DNA_ID=CAMNT_0019995967 /DNA_START=293 /DNA_END=469 /DNA_ORIENTATION=+
MELLMTSKAWITRCKLAASGGSMMRWIEGEKLCAKRSRRLPTARTVAMEQSPSTTAAS